MKKQLCIGIIVLIILCLCSCTNLINPDEEILEGKTSDTIVLPNAELSDVSSEHCITQLPNDNFKILDILNDNYYGYKSTEQNSKLEEEYIFINSDNNTQKSLNYEKGTEEWIIGSGSTIVMGNRFHYEWKSFTQKMTEDKLQDVRLIRIDGQSGNVEIIDKVKQTSPFIYLCKIDEEHFLSYSLTQTDSQKTDYAVISSASIYNIQGDKVEIINEKYENDENWSNSEGILIEKFAANHNELYGYGRKKIDNKYEHFLYHYDLNGKLIEEEQLNGFDEIIGSEQPIDFHYVGDYIAFRTYESVSNYICRKDGNTVELIMKGMDGQVQYAVTSKYILFIENNVDVYTDKIKEIECPLYVINTNESLIKAINLNIPIDNPYFIELLSISNDSVVLSYCEKEYNPLSIQKFLIDYSIIETL